MDWLIFQEALQLYTGRVNYIQAAASYSIAISSFRTSCDRVFVSAFAGYAHNELRLPADVTNKVVGLGKEMKKILAWNNEMTVSAKSLQDQLYVTRTKLEKEMSALFQPKRDLAVYQSHTLPAQEKSGGSRLGRLTIENNDPNRKRNYSVSSSGKPAKQGWLFHRVATGKPARWIRRWFFVKDGTFGWLHNSSKSAAVEESDRVGVLLCNVRVSPSEDRRFCFEVMTKSMNYMLQAETEGDLEDWIHVFELAKNAILADEKEHPQAFEIMAPDHSEFAIPLTDEHSSGGAPMLNTPPPVTPRASFDLASPASGSGSTQTSRSIVQKLESRLKDRPKGSPGAGGGIASLVAASQTAIAGQHVLVPQFYLNAPRPIDVFADPIAGSNIAPSTLALPPISTQMSIRAVQARSRAASSASSNAPSGVMANYWGIMHWGLVLVDQTDDATSGVDSLNQAQGSADTYFEKSQKNAIPHPLSHEIDKGSQQSTVSRRASHSKSTSSVDFTPTQYPPDYPTELKRQDSQFRALFPACRQDEFVLLVCRVMWQPVEGQQLWGRMYSTNSGLHFFAHAHGMVCVQRVPFSDIIRISHHVGISSDNIVIERENLDPIEAKVYLDSANLLTRRIDVLFRNSVSDQPTDTPEILHQLRQMEEERESDDDEKAGKSEDHEVDFEVDKASEALYGDEAAQHPLPSQLLRRSGDSLKVVFPSEAVHCDCKDHLEKRFAEFVFQIPAKSLFHLMFGDNTPIWKKVYRGRKVGDLEIGPWKSANKTLVRQYMYTVEFTDSASRISCLKSSLT